MKRYTKVILSMLLVLLLGVGLTACSNDDANNAQNANDNQTNNINNDTNTEATIEPTEKPKIGILVPDVTHGWVAAVAYHAEEYAKSLSGDIDYQIQTSSDAEEMTAQLDDLMTWGAEAIVAFPQWEGMETPIRKAINEGVEVVNFDIEIDVDGVYRVVGDNEEMGVEGAKYIHDKIGDEGNVVVLEVPTSDSISELRVKGFMDTIEEIAPDLKIKTYATKSTREDGLKDFADILTRQDEIDAVYAIDDEISIGVLQAIEEAGRDDIEVVTGGGGMQDYFAMMPKHDDIWIQSAMYSPAMVKDAIDVAIDVLDGQDVEQVTIIPTTIVDRDNVDEFMDADSPY